MSKEWFSPANYGPLVVSYYTDPFYAREAFDLARTCQTFGLGFLIKSVPDLGSWEENTNFKPTFLRDMLDRFPDRSLLWLDADARVRKFPQGLVDLFATIAYHTWKGRKPASGTVYLHGAMSVPVVEQWIKEVKATPMATDQVCMERAVNATMTRRVELPEEYCWVYDAHSDDPTASWDFPVIEHMQASRWVQKRAVASPPTRIARRRVK